MYPRVHQLRLEKINTTRRYMEEFREQQAEWRRMELQNMEEENRRILDYARSQERREEDRMESTRRREQAKENLHKQVCGSVLILLGTPSGGSHTYGCKARPPHTHSRTPRAL